MAIKTRQTTATGVTNVDAPLTNAEVDNNFVELQQNKVSTSGDTMTGDLNFGDSDKAVFGAGSDLQIYHDGSNSYVSDSGTGALHLRSTGGGVKVVDNTNAVKFTVAVGTGDVSVTGTVDGRDIAADGTKLDGIETGADVTDATNVQAAGALMDSELTNETAVKALNQSVATGSTPSFFNVNFTNNTQYTQIPFPYASGALYVADHIYHYGDTDTYIYMSSDDFRIVCGARQMLRMDEGADPDKLQFVNADNYVDSSGNWGMSGDVVWGGELRSGTFKLESDGTNHYIRNSAHTDGDIIIQAESSAGVNQTLARFDSSGVYTYAALYYNNGLSMTTTSGGITVHEYVKHYGDTDTYMGFDAVASWVAYTDGSKRISANNNGFFVESAARENATALSGTTPTCNADSAGYFSLTMTGNTTFTFSAQTSGYSAGFVVELTGNGGTVTWPTSVDWTGGTAPEPPASGETDLLVFNTRDGGTTWYGMLAIDAAA